MVTFSFSWKFFLPPPPPRGLGFVHVQVRELTSLAVSGTGSRALAQIVRGMLDSTRWLGPLRGASPPVSGSWSRTTCSRILLIARVAPVPTGARDIGCGPLEYLPWAGFGLSNLASRTEKMVVSCPEDHAPSLVDRHCGRSYRIASPEVRLERFCWRG